MEWTTGRRCGHPARIVIGGLFAACLTLLAACAPAVRAGAASGQAEVKPSEPAAPTPDYRPKPTVALPTYQPQPLPVPLDVAQILEPSRFAEIQLPYDRTRFNTLSYYEFMPTDHYIDIAAGSSAADPERGVIKVVVLGSLPGGPVSSQTDFRTSSPTGALTITSVDGDVVSLVSTSGAGYEFDLARRQFQ